MPPPPLPDELALRYLEVLGTDVRRNESDGEALRRLQRAHVERVPYETIDIVMGRPPGIDPIDSARRIVAGRGGYCYHLNGAFSALLDWLGFDVARHLAGVQGRGEEAPGPNGNHLALTVRTAAGGEWLVDVGLGDGPAEPMRLEDGPQEQDGYRYELRRSAELAGWRFEHDRSGSFAGFDMASATAVIGEFESMHGHLSTASGFARTVTVQRRFGDRIEIMRGCSFTEVSPSQISSREITERDAWWEIVIDHFRLAYDVPADERRALWQRVRADHETWKASQPS